jgi:AraC-like DNA-binding protein
MVVIRVLALRRALAPRLSPQPVQSAAVLADARHRTLLDRIKGHIETHFRYPGLTPDDIAAAANISTRYLHKLFEAEHQTVTLYLRGLRLRCARQELLDPRLAHRSVAEIAHGCGFGDLSGFNRAFKAAYGIPPGDLRRRADRRSR